MLLVGCLGTALCWNGRLLALRRNFLTLFLQLSVTITEDVLLHCTVSISESKPTHFCVITQNSWGLVLVTSGEDVTVKCGNILLSSVVASIQDAHEECCNMLESHQ
jgi:hypothetical protein